MNYTRIEYFLAAAEHLNTTKAANILYISQPSLSKQISLLEEELGVLLFTRSKNTLRLTPAGEKLYSEFSLLVPKAVAVLTEVKKMQAFSKGTISLGCLEALVIRNPIIEAIRDFVEQNSGNISFYTGRFPFEVLPNKIMDGSLDVALTIMSERDIKNLNYFNFIEI